MASYPSSLCLAVTVLTPLPPSFLCEDAFDYIGYTQDNLASWTLNLNFFCYIYF